MSVERASIRPGFDTPRIIKGNWQIADDHNASLDDSDDLYAHMAAFVDAGITAFDCGDIYAGVEERIGNFIARLRRERGAEAARAVTVHTKYVPCFLDEEGLRNLKPADIEATIDRSLRRLGTEALDLVQLHWWDYAIPGGVEMALAVQDMQKAGKIRQIGATNYNVAELRKLVDAGVDIVSNQIQFSVIDNRPLNGMTEYCKNNGIALFCYGSMGGGLISSKWLGISDPGSPSFENVSLDKYFRIILDFGGWDLFQELLRVMDTIARKHGVSIPVVASRHVLEHEGVTALIQGARHARHIADNMRLFTFALDQHDKAALHAVLSRAQGPAGDCYDIDRSENRDAEEELKSEYFDVQDGKLVTRTRDIAPMAELYGHHLFVAKTV